MILKVDRQGFLMVPKSDQNELLWWSYCPSKKIPIFARAPCRYTEKDQGLNPTRKNNLKTKQNILFVFCGEKKDLKNFGSHFFTYIRFESRHERQKWTSVKFFRITFRSHEDPPQNKKFLKKTFLSRIDLNLIPSMKLENVPFRFGSA